jgi:uncharacterized membrane protein
MTGGVTVVLVILAFVLMTSMSASGERFRAFLLAAVILLLSSTPFFSAIHDVLLKLITSFG